MKFAEFEEFGRYGHTRQIAMITNSLKVATDKQKIDSIAFFSLEGCYMRVNCIEFAMTATFYGNLREGGMSLFRRG